MKLKKQELVKKIGGVDVLFSKIKYSILYLIIVEKKSEKGNILERYIKWGRTSNPVSRFKQHQKHYIDYEIKYIYLSSEHGCKWIDVECAIYERHIRKQLNSAFPRYKDFMPNKIHGYTEMYMGDQITDQEIIHFVKHEINLLKHANFPNLHEFSLIAK